MFLRHFGLREQPFGVTPDPRFLYDSESHSEALRSLTYAIQSDLGFSSLISEPGLGKTTLLNSLLESYSATCRTAFVFSNHCHSREILSHVLADFEIPAKDDDLNAMFRAFRDMLLEEARRHRRVILFIDEAHLLGEPALETVRLLSNFEATNSKLLHIVLAGQLQLADLLQQPPLESLRQRITTSVRLRSLNWAEVAEYIDHRLRRSGSEGDSLFTHDAVTFIAEHSRGIPREINRICANAMTVSYERGEKTVGVTSLRAVVDDAALHVAHNDNVYPFTTARSTQKSTVPVATYALGPNTLGSQALAMMPEISEEPMHTGTPQVAPAVPSFSPELSTEISEEPVHAETPQVTPAVASFPPEPSTEVSEEPVHAETPEVTTAVPSFSPEPSTEEHTAEPATAVGKATQEVRAIPSDPIAALRSEIRETVPVPTRGDRSKSVRTYLVSVAILVFLVSTIAILLIGRTNIANREQTSASVASAAVSGDASGKDLPQGAVLVRTVPVYPARARAAHQQGSVTVRAHVDKVGKVTSARFLKGDAVFANAAVNAVHHWAVVPFRRDGSPIEGDVDLLVPFTLKEASIAK